MTLVRGMELQVREVGTDRSTLFGKPCICLHVQAFRRASRVRRTNVLLGFVGAVLRYSIQHVGARHCVQLGLEDI